MSPLTRNLASSYLGSVFLPLSGAVRFKLGKPAAVGWEHHQGGNLSEGGQELSYWDVPTVCTWRWTCDDNGLRWSHSGNFLLFLTFLCLFCSWRLWLRHCISFSTWVSGFLQGWDFESINTAIGNTSNRFEMEPINEMMVGHNVSLSFAVKSSMPDSFTWFAQVGPLAVYEFANFTKTFPNIPHQQHPFW